MNVFQSVFERRAVRSFRGYLSAIGRYSRRRRQYHFWFGVASALRRQGVVSEARVKRLLAEGVAGEALGFLDGQAVVANWYAEYQRSIEGAYRGYVSYEGSRRFERAGSREQLRVAFYCAVQGMYADYLARKGSGWLFRVMRWCVRYVF